MAAVLSPILVNLRRCASSAACLAARESADRVFFRLTQPDGPPGPFGIDIETLVLERIR
jgi:hypothetical protein